eukprot:bmy_12984T0
MSLILFTGSTNLLGLLSHSLAPTTQLSMNLGMAVPLNTQPPHPYTSNYRDYQPIYPTSSISHAIDSQYYSRALVDPSNGRDNASTNKQQHCYSFYYIHHSYPNYCPRICHCYNSSLCIYSPC